MKKRVVVVTGASAGVGRAIAREFAKKGCRVALIARGEVGLHAAAKEVIELGGEALVLPLDVSRSDSVEEAASKITGKWGRIDVWINNAMVSVFSPADRMLPEEYRRVTEVTYLGYVYGTLAALKEMKRRDRGVIIQIGSALALRSIPLQSAYCAAKHAVVGFTESVRTELLHDKSRVQICQVNLPAVNTPQFSWSKSRLPKSPQPVPPIYQPEVIAEAVYHVALHPRRRLDIAYSTVQAVMAEKVAPSLADRYLAIWGYSSQMTDLDARSDRKDNLWTPVNEDRGARGSFDSRAHGSSPLLWMDLHRKGIAIAAAAAWLGYRVAKKKAA